MCKEAGTHRITSTFSVEGSNLGICKGNVAVATGRVWELYDKKKAAEHRRFDVGELKAKMNDVCMGL